VERRRHVRLSKLISLLLRHDPDRAGLDLDRGGWVATDALLDGLARLGHQIDHHELETLVTGGGKHRFELRGQRIRARYGHSVAVDLGYGHTPPPDVLFHGTASRHVRRIRAEGISPMSRQQVHLSETRADAEHVGARHGRPVVLAVDARAMADAGTVFHRLPGGTWLVDAVPPERVLGPVDDERTG
jgi:putative RNA 2'-phosphotransferase